MSAKLVRHFVVSAGVLLMMAGFAKVISSFGHSRVLEMEDSIFAIKYRLLFQLVGFLEMSIAFFCLSFKKPKLQSGFIAYLATCFLAYRVGMIWVGYHKPCDCLGTLTDALHLSPNTAATVMKCILAYLLIGSYVTLFCLWRRARRVPQQDRSSGVSVSAT